MLSMDHVAIATRVNVHLDTFLLPRPDFIGVRSVQSDFGRVPGDWRVLPSVQCLHITLRQLEVKEVNVFLNALVRYRLG